MLFESKFQDFNENVSKKPGNKQNLLQSFIYSKQKNIAVINSTIYFILQNIFIHNTDNFFMGKISIFKGLNVFSFLRLSILLLSMTIFSKTSFHVFLYSQKFVDIKIFENELRKLFRWSFPFFYSYFKATSI